LPPNSRGQHHAKRGLTKKTCCLFKKRSINFKRCIKKQKPCLNLSNLH
jgi:hypothetical protein